MLGTSAKKLQYRTINDFNSPADYLEYLFGGVQGIMYRATINPKYFQTYYRSSGLVNAEYEGVNNCYIAMNSFFRSKSLEKQQGRDLRHLKRLNAFYVDIDCYKVGLTKSEVIDRLNYEYFGSRIPEPTFIVDSGRGIYLIWKLRNEDRNALSRWTAVQNYLVDTLEPLGADQACKDAARILRVPFSVNSKSNSVVSIMEFNDLTYSIYDISKEYEISSVRKSKLQNNADVKKYPYNHATERQRKYVRDIAKHLGLSKEDYPDFANFKETDTWIKKHKDISVTHREEKTYCYKKGNTYSLDEFKSFKGVLGSYCIEIRKLLTMRKGTDCKRELALFLYRYFLREMKYDKETALEETLDFNASLDCPFEREYVITATASADRRIETGVPYAYSKSTIIKLLEITKDELAYLPFLAKAVRDRKECRKEQNRKAYEKKLSAEGKSAKKDDILKRRASILAMQGQGKTSVEIQKELNISRATYHRDTAALAITSVYEAAKAMLAEQTEKITKTAKKAAEAVSDIMKTAKKESFVASVRGALKDSKESLKELLKMMSHFFSIPFIECTAKLYRTPPLCLYIPVRWFIKIVKLLRRPLSEHGSNKGNGSDDETDEPDADG